MNVTTVAAARVRRKRNRTALLIVALVVLVSAAFVPGGDGTAAGKAESKSKPRDVRGEAIHRDHKGQIEVLKGGADGQAGKPRPRQNATAPGTRQQGKKASGSK